MSRLTIAVTVLASTLSSLALARDAHEKKAAEAPPNDAQIAAIVLSANQVDIDAGLVAEKASENPEVKAFAKTMVADHSGVNQQAAALAKKLGVTPEPNDTSRSLEAGGRDNLARLAKLKGAAFDKAYVDHEVAYHEAVLHAIDQTLVPHAKNAELRNLILAVRPAIAAHLGHAKMMQASMRGVK